jgi:Tol biopolymer transport system component
VIGRTLAQYRVTASIGAGGMGEVYRATDTRLGRDVAVKIVLASQAGDPDRLKRFETEARAAGTLNHPNILAIYDVGAEGGSPYVVSELLEGETLRDRLTSAGALPSRKASDYAIQLAHGLAAAHQKGIVHRDLKPENLFITADGRLKILDFGLAKLIQADRGPEPGATVATSAGTEPGMVLGTMGYMSPEQVRGRAADARSDIFAFGVILYEMLAGSRAFHGESAVETMNAILKEEPPELSTTARGIPSALERIVPRCLEKNPAERFPSARDLAFGLEAIAGHSGTATTVAGSESAVAAAAAGPMPRAAGRWTRSAALALGVVAVGALAFWAGKRVGSAGAPVAFPTFQRLTFRNGSLSNARFAPDGQTILYSASWDRNPAEVFSTRPGSPESRSLGLKSANLFAVSSAGDIALGLQRPNGPTLARVSLAGGAPREILEEVQRADWAPNGSDFAVVRNVGRKNRIEFPLGKVLYETSDFLGSPRISPKGDRIAFTESNGGRHAISVIDLAGKKTVLSKDWKGSDDLAWSPTGEEVWFTATESGFGYAIYAATVSEAPKMRLLLRMAGPVFLKDVARDGRVIVAHDNVRTAMMCLRPGDAKERDLAWFDADVPTALSDDGQILLFNEHGEASGTKYPIYIRKTDGSDAVRLGEGLANALSHDGKWVVTTPLPNVSALVLLPTGAGQARTLTNDVIKFYGGASWLPDDKRLVVVGVEGGNHAPRSWVLDLEGGNPRAITPEGVTGLLPSPDGKLLLTRHADGSRKLYPIDGGEPRDAAGFEQADRALRWYADGRSVFVRQSVDEGAKVFLVDTTTGRRTFWKELTVAEPSGSSGVREILLTPDGKSYVYWYVRDLTDLYLVEGLK